MIQDIFIYDVDVQQWISVTSVEPVPGYIFLFPDFDEKFISSLDMNQDDVMLKWF